MLHALSIRDVVLIERLDLTFGTGLSVLTGETGAGKSILLDALGLALGVRAEARLVRHGTKQAVVSATFDGATSPQILEILTEHGLDPEDDDLILRRVLTPDGRSRAFVNDQAVSVALLKRLGESLVEIHGQFESQRLLSPANHRGLLDAYGGLNSTTQSVKEAWQGWRDARDALATAQESMAAARRDEAFLRHAVEELENIDPSVGEEETLSTQRQLMMHGEKISDSMSRALQELSNGKGVEGGLRAALRALQDIADKADGRLDTIIETLDRAAIETAEAQALLEKAGEDFDLDTGKLETVEERLFALRALGRKHDVEVNALPALLEDMQQKLSGVEDGGMQLKALEKAEIAAKETFVQAGRHLTENRRNKARKLDEAMGNELQPLKLEKAQFVTKVAELPESEWNESGMDAVAFEISTNPGSPPGPLSRIASGGELARFMLALKAVLAQSDSISTLIFDEVDSGIGGAVAAAVGERLAELGKSAQVLVVTHAPQVASRGAHHLKVMKSGGEDGVVTSVGVLSTDERKEEIARMLAGSEVTEQARSAAESLLQDAGK